MAERHSDTEAEAEDWREQRRDARRLLRRLPHALRREVERAYRSDIRESVARGIMDRVLAIAQARGLTRVRRARRVFDRDVEDIMAVDERMILRELSEARDYVQHVHRAVDRALRTAHLAKLDPVSIERFPPPASISMPAHSERWEAECDLGLGTASFLGEAPDAFYVAAARHVLRGDECGECFLGPDEGTGRTRVLVLNPAGSGFARAAASLGVSAQLAIQELGAEFVAADIPGVHPHREAVVRVGRFDACVWAVPAPAAPGATSQIQAYRGPDGGDLRKARFQIGAEVVVVPSPFAVGPKRWRASVETILRKVAIPALKVGGTLVLRLPMGLRTYERPRNGRPGRHGYEAVHDMIEPLLLLLPRNGLHIVSSSEIEEVDPVNQPFVGSSRCRSLVLFAQRRSV